MRIGENNDKMNTNQSGEEDPVEQTVFSTEGKQQRSDSAITSMKGNAPMDKGNKPNISLGSLPTAMSNKKECYVNSKRVLKPACEINVEVTGADNPRFKDGRVGAAIVIVKLKRERVNAKRSRNFYKILKSLIKLKIYPNDILMRHASAEVKFDNAIDANSCLDKITELGNSSDLSATTDRRCLSCRGVIMD